MCRNFAILSLTLAVLTLSLAQQQPQDSTQWTHHAVLDDEGKVHLFWTPGIKDITFEVHAETKGYIAIGFSPTGGMPGSDIVVGWVINNAPTLQDRYAIDNSEPLMDAQPHYNLLGGYETDTKTVLKFQRDYDTCDHQDWKITNDTTKVIYAYHPDDPISDRLMHHTRAGHRSLYLAGFNHPLPEGIPNSRSVEMRLSNVMLPMVENTLCWEKVFKATPVSPTDAIIGFKPVWGNATVSAIDHMWLFRCDVTGNTAAWDQYSNTNGDRCSHSTAATPFANCTQVLATATAGSMGYMLPPQVGVSFKESASVYFLLQISYRNWKKQENLVDDSGFRVIFTTTPVTSQAGTLTVGHHLGISQIIPIDQKDFSSTGYCDGECSGMSFPPEGIFIYEVFLYARQYGRKMTLKHIRKGEELEGLANDDRFEGNVQVYRALMDPIHMLPGDYLILNCNYETTQAQSTTLGGLLQDNETCLAFLNYYPQVDLKSCVSSPPLTQLYQWLDTKQVEVEPTKYSEVSPNGQDPKLVQFVKNYNWASRAAEFQKFVRDSYTAVCTYRGKNETVSGTRIPPKIESPFYRHSKCGDKFDNTTGMEHPPMEPPVIDIGHHDHGHGGHDHGDHSHGGHDHGDHDHPGSETPMGDQPISEPGASQHPNSIEGTTQAPGHTDKSQQEGSSSSMIHCSLSILIMAIVTLVISKQ